MKRHVVILAALAAAIAPVASTAAPNPRLTEARSGLFPDRTFILSLPTSMHLSADRVRVTENGKEVTKVGVVPVSESDRGDFGVVLAIDASNSMKGKAIDGALNAARTFLGTRSPNELVAILTFNRETRLIQPFTTDREALFRALAKAPPLAEGTHIYDAVQASLDVLTKRRITAGSIILLSDGSDTGSLTRQRRAVAEARDSRIRVFTVGLRSKQFNPSTLASIASRTNARYAEATGSADLEKVFQSLGTELSREYLVHYRSLLGPNLPARVAVSITGVKGMAKAAYRTPKLHLPPAAPYHKSAIDEAIQSPLAAALVAVFASILVAFGVVTAAREPRETVRDRVGGFVSLVGNDPAGRTSGLPDRVFVGAERGLQKSRFWGRFKELVELAEISMPPVQIALWSIVGAIVFGWVCAALVGTPLAAVFGLFVPFAAYQWVSSKVARKRRLFADQLPDNLQIVASALRAGHSLIGALSVVVDDAAEPTRSEFRRVIADERLGVPLEDALEVVVRRMDSRELAQVALVAALQRRTGGNAAEVLDRVVEVIRERAELRRLVRTLTAQGRMSRWVLTALPVGLVVVISLVNADYLSPLFHTGGGRIALAVAALMAAAGSFAIRRIVNIKV